MNDGATRLSATSFAKAKLVDGRCSKRGGLRILCRRERGIRAGRSSLPNGKLAAGSWRACGKLVDGRCSKRESLAVVDKVSPSAPSACCFAFAKQQDGSYTGWRKSFSWMRDGHISARLPNGKLDAGLWAKLVDGRS